MIDHLSSPALSPKKNIPSNRPVVPKTIQDYDLPKSGPERFYYDRSTYTGTDGMGCLGVLVMTTMVCSPIYVDGLWKPFKTHRWCIIYSYRSWEFQCANPLPNGITPRLSNTFHGEARAKFSVLCQAPTRTMAPARPEAVSARLDVDGEASPLADPNEGEGEGLNRYGWKIWCHMMCAYNSCNVNPGLINP